MKSEESIGDDSLLDEFEEVCRAYGPGKIRQTKTPYLTAIADRLGVTRDELVELSVSGIENDRYRATAYALLVDPEVRQNNFTQRTRLAAAEFGVGVDAFRRVPKGGGLSSRSLVLLEAAQSSLDLDVPVVSDDQPNKALAAYPEPALSLDIETRDGPAVGGRSPLLFAFAGLLIAVALGAFFVGRSANETASISLAGEVDVTLQCTTQVSTESVAIADPESSGWLCKDPDGQRHTADIEEACDTQYGSEASAQNLSGNNASWRCVTHFPVDSGALCPFAAGAFNPSSSHLHSPFASGFRRLYDEAGGSEVLGCPTQLIHQYAVGVMQEIETEDGQESAILAVKSDLPILLTGTAWQAFDRVKGITGDIVGFPITKPYELDGAFYIHLSAGGSLISVSSEAPFYWVPPIVVESWHSIGGVDSCVGLPISDPYTAGANFKQDFEHGTFSLNVVTGELAHTGVGC